MSEISCESRERFACSSIWLLVLIFHLSEWTLSAYIISILSWTDPDWEIHLPVEMQGI